MTLDEGIENLLRENTWSKDFQLQKNDQCWLLSLPVKHGYRMELTITPSIYEVYVSLFTSGHCAKIWEDWTDYPKEEGLSNEDLIEEKIDSIRCVIALWFAASEIRVKQTQNSFLWGIFKSGYTETQFKVDGCWKNLWD